ncbi:MAG: methyltransferase domain-containing protein [Proteobacteria bacterium]|nr:methyltransferase domain-containing protein [Pseudomonadota bacterium]
MMKENGNKREVKLDICGGSFPMGEDYVNVDVRPLPGVDVVADLTCGLPFNECTIAEIASCGTLEHFDRNELNIVLAEIYRVMEYDTKLTIGVPDLNAIMNAYLLGEMDFCRVNQYLYGSQENPYDLHKMALDFEELYRRLRDVGFTGIRKVEYTFPFHIPKYMIQVECFKRKSKESTGKSNDKMKEETPSEGREMKFTGERLVPGDPNLNDLYVKHQARYLFAGQYVRDKVVLDAGCGCGYGTHTMALAGARKVVGIDNSPAAIAYSKKYYPLENSIFLNANCIDMPFPDQFFDRVVSFEVLEHIPDYEKYLSECYRVLRTDGLFIVSTPNKKLWAEKENPHHFREFYLNEFKEILEDRFVVLEILGQDLAPGYTVRSQNDQEIYTFLVTMRNYYDESFRYTERQMGVLRDTTQKEVDSLQEALSKQQEAWSKQFDFLVGNYVWFLIDVFFPVRLKRFFPRFLKRKIRDRINAKVMSVQSKRWNGSHFTESSGSSERVDFKWPRISLPPLGKVYFPVNPDRKNLSRPPIAKVPFGISDIVIRKEFIEDASYFIALCRKE